MMSHIFSKSFCAVFLIFFSGCVTVAHFAPSMQNQVYAMRTPAEKIELFRTQVPEKKYVEIGAVNVHRNSNVNIQIDALRAKASEAGGDAIIALEIDATVGATATVIRYLRNN